MVGGGRVVSGQTHIQLRYAVQFAARSQLMTQLIYRQHKKHVLEKK